MDDFDPESRRAAAHRAHKFHLSDAARQQGEADQRNGALMRQDPLLVKLLWVFTSTPAEGRAEFVARALAAQPSNKG